MNPPIQPRQTTPVFLAAFGLVCFGLLPQAQAVSPPPDGGYPGGNTAEGQNALLSLSSGGYNSAIGWLSLESNVTGTANTAVGAGTLALNTADGNTATGAVALLFNKVAIHNTAAGAFALFNNNSTGNARPNGCWNSAFGEEALFSNTDGAQNAAFGESAMHENTTGNFNTGINDNALRLNQTGSGNTAIGYFALSQNTAGDNTAAGYGALFDNTTGTTNTAMGAGALSTNTTGASNAATGFDVLFNKTTGSGNTAMGYLALEANTTGSFNTAIGTFALQNNTGAGNTALGQSAGGNLTTGDNNICIDSLAIAGDAGVIRIGSNLTNGTYIAGISGVTVSGGTAVFVSANGQLGTNASSARFKEEIKPMNKASEAILALKPVSFRYKKEIDPHGVPQFGLVAEDVDKVNRDLVVRDEEGKPYSVRYEQVNAMLLNEFLKEHQTVQELKTTVVQQQKQMDSLTAGLQSVSAQLEVSKARCEGLRAHSDATLRCAPHRGAAADKSLKPAGHRMNLAKRQV